MEIKINEESMEQAVKEFNEWGKGARLYFDVTDGEFETAVYHNDVMMSETFSSENFIAVYSKTESKGHIKIGTKRKEYIVKFCNLLLDGWEVYQAEYKLAEYDV